MRIVCVLLILPCLALPAPAVAEQAGFMLCEADPHITCVWSGDSFYLRGQLIRLSDITAPQRYTSECPTASNLSWLAALKLRDLLNAGPFELTPSGKAGADGAQPNLVVRDGKSLGAELIAAGLAKVATQSSANWCN